MSFTGVIDKGTLDAILCGAEAAEGAVDMLFNISRWGGSSEGEQVKGGGRDGW